MKIRQRRAPAALEPSLDFTPVVLDKPRADGWTPERQRGFVYALADLGSVRAACATVGMASVGAYALRRRKDAESFARAWARAQAAGVKALRDIAYERAVDGTPRGIWYQGERVGEERRYNDRLLMFMLRHEQPSSYGAPKRLPRGTKHPDTVAREARWAAEDAEDAVFEEVAPEAEPVDPVAKRLGLALWSYTFKIIQEREARLNGDVVKADFLVRQLTVLEIMAEAGQVPNTADGWDMMAHNGIVQQVAPYRPRNETAAFIDNSREWAWRITEDFLQRPDCGAMRRPPAWGINDYSAKDRLAAQEEAKALIAKGQALWEAAGSEARWAAWSGGEQSAH